MPLSKSRGPVMPEDYIISHISHLLISNVCSQSSVELQNMGTLICDLNSILKAICCEGSECNKRHV
jgi:hypothetical protein